VDTTASATNDPATGSVIVDRNIKFPVDVELMVIGAGASGLTASLAACDHGIETVILERDDYPSGSTALSSGMIPACDTYAQRRAGVVDSPGQMGSDIQGKAQGQAPNDVVKAVCEASGPAIDWLRETHAVELELVEGFLYPGHSVPRMHAPPSRTGAALMGSLLNARERTESLLMCGARVTTLFTDGNGVITGAEINRTDGSSERIGCRNLLLACNGYGGNTHLVARHLPEMSAAAYFGHAGNQGDALVWGEALGAASGCLKAYQGHGSVAVPHQILITWALMMEGGIQVNSNGERFSNEHDGYSEQAVRVIAQPNGVAWNIYDKRLHELGMEFEDYRTAVTQGAILSAPSLAELAKETSLPLQRLERSVALTGTQGKVPDGRDFGATLALQAPYFAVRVAGALFHTQGGLSINAQARVLTGEGKTLPNLYASGGAACGVSGKNVAGYLSGNGLLSAVTLGRIAADNVARGGSGG
jgi:fumarate reductase flavoprotein subunit